MVSLIYICRLQLFQKMHDWNKCSVSRCVRPCTHTHTHTELVQLLSPCDWMTDWLSLSPSAITDHQPSISSTQHSTFVLISAFTCYLRLKSFVSTAATWYVVKYLHKRDANTAVVCVSCMTMHEVKCVKICLYKSNWPKTINQLRCLVFVEVRGSHGEDCCYFNVCFGHVIRPGEARAARVPAVTRAARSHTGIFLINQHFLHYN